MFSFRILGVAFCSCFLFVCIRWYDHLLISFFNYLFLNSFTHSWIFLKSTWHSKFVYWLVISLFSSSFRSLYFILSIYLFPFVYASPSSFLRQRILHQPSSLRQSSCYHSKDKKEQKGTRKKGDKERKRTKNKHEQRATKNEKEQN